jgi:hypothetical protein
MASLDVPPPLWHLINAPGRSAADSITRFLRWGWRILSYAGVGRAAAGPDGVIDERLR